MKKIHFALIALIGLTFSLQSCKDDIEITGDFVETAVVYGLLDQADSLHYIKVTRAFIGPGNAFDIAKIPDSSYFASVTGTVMEFTDGNYSLNPSGEYVYNTNNASRTFNLRDTTIDNKDTGGVFYAPEQKLYYFPTTSSAPLLDDALYVMSLSINGGAFTVKGETELVNNLSSAISSQTQPYKFVTNQGEYKATTVVVNNGGTGNHKASQINTTIEITIEEFIGSTSALKTFKWNLGDAETTSTSVPFTASGSTFYEIIKENCTNDASITKRNLISMDAVITGGSDVLYRYIQANQPVSGLAQSKPTYTNLIASGGHPVVGIFSARQTVRINSVFYNPSASGFVRALDKSSTERLCTGSITGTYLFCSQHTADASETWFCTP